MFVSCQFFILCKWLTIYVIPSVNIHLAYLLLCSTRKCAIPYSMQIIQCSSSEIHYLFNPETMTRQIICMLDQFIFFLQLLDCLQICIKKSVKSIYVKCEPSLNIDLF